MTAIRETAGNVSLADPEVMELARGERRAIVTDNLSDYRPLHHSAIITGGQGHYGMVLILGGYRRTKGDTGRIVAALQAVLTEHPGEDDLANTEAWL